MTIFAVPSNLAFETYTALKDAISDWMDRTDLSGSVATMIALAEARMRRQLEPLFVEKSVTITTTGGVYNLPGDFGTGERLIYTERGYTVPRYSSLNVADLDLDTSAAQPYGYTIENGQIRVWPSCDVTMDLLYRPVFEGLSDANLSNEVLSLFPDAYFFGAMLFAEGYVANDQRAGLFKGLFDEALGEVAAYYQRQKFSGPLAPRIRREW